MESKNLRIVALQTQFALLKVKVEEWLADDTDGSYP
jgi:hypothetical protein